MIIIMIYVFHNDIDGMTMTMMMPMMMTMTMPMMMTMMIPMTMIMLISYHILKL